MPIAEAMAGGLAKSVAAWLGSLLTGWIKEKKANAQDKAAWAEVATQILEQTTLIADRYQKISTVAFPRQPVCVNDIYVPLTLKSTSQPEKFLIDKFPRKIFVSKRKILIVDVAGMGKSTISKILYLRALDEKLFLPLLIDLRRLDGGESIEHVLTSQFGIRPKHSDIFAEFLTTQPLLFLFDGFDEIQDSKKLKVARLIREFVDRAKKGKFVITSRPELEFSDYTDFALYQIQELTKDQSHLLITKYGDAFNIPDRAKALLEELRARHDGPVESFLKNPLLASLLFRAFEFKSVVPVKRGVFYRQVFDALYEAHDLSKETGYVRDKRTGLHHDDFHRAVRAMAKLFREKHVVEVDHSSFIAMAKQITKSLCPDLSFTADAFLHDVVHAVPLFTRDGNFVRWAHKSLLDYFLAEFLLRDYSESKEDALRRSAFGMGARANENFLVLVHEADPILFAHAVTLPAIDTLLERSDRLLDLIPESVDAEVRDDAVAFFTSYEAIFREGEDFEPLVKRLRNASQDGLPDFVPRAIYHLGPDTGLLAIFLHDAAVALQVPMTLGAVPYDPIYTLTRKYLRDKNGETEGLDGFLPFFPGTDAARDWLAFDEVFGHLMGIIHEPEFKFLAPTGLRKAKADLEQHVLRSMKARSNNVF